jgi:phospholipase/carboxylesterase
MTDPFANQTPRDDGTAIQLGPEQASRRLVLLHGWGADADDLLDLGLELLPKSGLSAAELAQISLVALRAPGIHPAGMGRQWYGLAPAPDWQALPDAREELRQRLEALAQTVPLQQTILLGFSQGGAMAVDVATGGGQAGADPSAAGLPLAALISCSGYPHPGWSPRAEGLRVLLTHGLQDPVVPAEASEALEQELQAAGAHVKRQLFTGGHGIDPDLLPLMREFLGRAWEAAGAN